MLCRLTRALVAAAWLLPAAELTAGTGVWTGGGPEGGRVVQFLANSAAPDLLYAQTATNAIFLQRAGSTRWQRAGLSLPPLIRDMALATDGTLYAAEASAPRLWRSVDHGSTWEERGVPAQVEEFFAIAAAGGMPERVYLSGWDYETGRWLYRSDDGGKIWSTVAPLSHGSTGLRTDPLDPDVLYNDTALSGPVERSDDGGHTWVSTHLPYSLSVLALDPVSPQVLYALWYSSVWKSLNRGDTWSQVGQIDAPPGYSARFLALDPTDPQRLAAAYWYRVYLSENGGTAWREIDSLPPSGPYALTFDPRFAGRLVAGSGEGVHAITTSGQASWHASNQGLRARSASVLWAARREADLVVQGDSTMGPWRSLDGGVTWNLAVRGLPIHGVAYHALDGAPSGVPLYLGSWYSHHRSLDRGRTWRPIATDWSYRWWVHTLAAVDPFGGVLFGGGTAYSLLPAVERSEDQGHTWSTFYTAATVQITAPQDVAVDPNEPARAFLGNLVLGEGCTVDRTEDGGASWLPLLGWKELGSCYYIDIALEPLQPEHVYVLGLGLAPNDPRHSRFQAFLRSLDGGDTWEAIGEELPCFRSLALDPTNSDLYLGCDQIYVSRDHGETWSPFSTTGLPPDLGLIGALTFAFQDDRLRLYAATNVGVYSYTWPEP